MARYTIELRTLVNNPFTQPFNFIYDFYCKDETMKKEFEQKFINRYYYHEIGAETFERWQYMLKSRLTLKMPYYKQLYETELKSKDISFLLNKDLKETFTRELSEASQSNSQSTGVGSFKESSINDGVALVNLDEENQTTENANTSSTDSTSEGTSNQQEKTEFISKGNIGVTSSAQLLKEWREVLINIDNIIIDDCRDLFMSIY